MPNICEAESNPRYPQKDLAHIDVKLHSTAGSALKAARYLSSLGTLFQLIC